MTVWITRRDDDDVSAELAAAPSGPLAGVRLAVKDNVDVAGLPTTAACPEFAYLPQRDAAAIAALPPRRRHRPADRPEQAVGGHVVGTHPPRSDRSDRAAPTPPARRPVGTVSTT